MDALAEVAILGRIRIDEADMLPLDEFISMLERLRRVSDKRDSDLANRIAIKFAKVFSNES